jgi:nucleotide-binding universal stress UspA family protein
VALIVGYDRHPASRAALLFAAELTAALNVPLAIVHVADLSDMIGAEPSASTDERHADLERQRIAAVLSNEVRWSYCLVGGDPVDALIEAASQYAASMIVVGRPQQGISAAIGHIVSGAVARNLMRRSPIPVVVVPESTGGRR